MLAGSFRERPYDACNVIWRGAVYPDTHHACRRCCGCFFALAACFLPMPPDEIGEILDSFSAARLTAIFVDQCKKRQYFETLARPRHVLWACVVRSKTNKQKRATVERGVKHATQRCRSCR